MNGGLEGGMAPQKSFLSLREALPPPVDIPVSGFGAWTSSSHFGSSLTMTLTPGMTAEMQGM